MREIEHKKHGEVSRACPERVESRRHCRYPMVESGSRLSLVRKTAAGLRTEICRLQDLSYSGMRFEVGRKLETDRVYHFHLTVRSVLEDSASLTARIVWGRLSDSGSYVHGAEFLESSKGWLGPDED